MKTVTSKEALFMLETSMEQDMAANAAEVTKVVIKTINRSPELYKRVLRARELGKSNTIQMVDNISQTCYDWAEEHNNEFGDLLQTELDQVSWEEVIKKV